MGSVTVYPTLRTIVITGTVPTALTKLTPTPEAVRPTREKPAMSFQAYLDTIKAKTGKSPDDFRTLAKEKGFIDAGTIAPGVKATEITDWLKSEFALGHGHAMAIYALLKGAKKEGDG